MENPALLALMFARRHSPTGGTELADAVGRAFAIPVTIVSQEAADELLSEMINHLLHGLRPRSAGA